MPGPINIPPRGLLTQFGLQGVEQYPKVIADALAWTYGADIFFRHALREYGNMSFSATNTIISCGQVPASAFTTFSGAFVSAAVPANEQWLITRWAITQSITAGAGTSFGGVFLLSFGGNQVEFGALPGRRQYAADRVINIAGNVNRIVGSCGAEPIIIPSGMTLAPWLNATAAGELWTVAAADTLTVAANIEFVRLRG